MEDESYINNSNYNLDQLSRAKKYAKLIIFVACIGVLCGLSASALFYFKYDLIVTPSLALISGNFLKNYGSMVKTH